MQETPSRPQPPRRDWPAWTRQALAFAALAGLLLLLFRVTSANLQARGVHTGFEFLLRPAVTPVVNSPLEFVPGTSSFGRALATGALNTLKLTAASIVASTLLGLWVGLGASSRHPLARRLCSAYVEAMRNVPVLLHVVLWYGIVLELPSAAEAAKGLFLASNRGIYLLPTVDGLDVQGLVSMSPEFFALLVGISTYTAAFIAEIVRASVGSVDTGQWEACTALGLSGPTTLGRVVAPQALRVGIPPLASEYMGIFKNSTLAVAVGYQDFMAVGETMLTDTGQALEIMAIVLAFYAMVSLAVSAAIHAFELRHHRWSHR
jgi:general L-amino acid transport system permease protein